MVTFMAAGPAAGPDGAPPAAAAAVPGSVKPAGRAGRPPGPAAAGFRLRPEPGLRALNGGTVLLGGYPHRLLRLGAAGARHVTGWWAGEPVADSPGAQTLARRLLETGIALPVPSGGPRPQDVTVVIPVRDRTAELTLCLRGLRGYRVLVVDDGSRDPAAVARWPQPRARPACTGRSTAGPPPPATPAWPRSDTPLVAFLDSDCVPAPGWLDGLLPHFADPVVAAVAPRIVPYEPEVATGHSQPAQFSQYGVGWHRAG